jgi:hypothetical protein
MMEYDNLNAEAAAVFLHNALHLRLPNPTTYGGFRGIMFGNLGL